jgi:hypothetical protein
VAGAAPDREGSTSPLWIESGGASKAPAETDLGGISFSRDVERNSDKNLEVRIFHMDNFRDKANKRILDCRFYLLHVFFVTQHFA